MNYYQENHFKAILYIIICIKEHFLFLYVKTFICSNFYFKSTLNFHL